MPNTFHPTPPTSHLLFQRAERVIPGGVNSPVRAFGSVGGTPIYVTEGNGCRIMTVDGQELIDFCCSWGPLILGHANPEIVDAITTAAASGSSFGINTPREVEFAELLCELIPSMDKVRLVSSGTEATMTALRLARGVTGRSKIVKFDGCYHGHSDSLLVAAGSGLLTGGISSSAGVSPNVADDTIVVPYNDEAAIREVFAACGDTIAAVIVEPVAGNMGLVEPLVDFLQSLREVTSASGSLLIFDEVITGFRFGPTTYGTLIGIGPDITCLGKTIGGGLPIGAVGGRADVMDALAPLGAVYQAGTLSGNPVAVAAGMATIKVLKRDRPYDQLGELGEILQSGLNAAAASAGVPFHCALKGGVFTPFFRSAPVARLDDAKQCDTEMFGKFFHAMLERGFYLSPSQFEVGFVSTAHTRADIDAFVSAAGEAFKVL
jgi:glutamate-1-semialdehyde 2,1-aminomutase